MGVLGLVLLVALAGCIGALGADSTGMNFQDDADENAQSWDEGADLVGVVGAEHDTNGTPPAEQEAYNASEGTVGDGQAPAWNYTYENDEQAFSVIVAANGTVLDQRTHQHEDRTPITGWEIDSTDAIQALEDANETWANATPDTAAYTLSQNSTNEDPIWSMVIVEEDAPPLIGLVNATTGDVLDVYAFEFDFNFNFTMGPMFGPGPDAPPSEQGSFSGTLTLTEPEAEHALEVENAGHGELSVALHLEDPAASSVTGTLEGPNGTAAALEADATNPEHEITWDEPAPGPYEVRLEMEQGVTQDYRIEWCAHSPSWFSGFSPGPFGSSNAC